MLYSDSTTFPTIVVPTSVTISFGRSPLKDLPADPSSVHHVVFNGAKKVSKVHCKVEVVDGVAMLIDVSANGTFVDGDKKKGESCALLFGACALHARVSVQRVRAA